MKFNEKLIELRRKEGLSQEEFGYKLNVTRQTVSKWELAQTTPEMDKLKEIGRIFNMSVDELINESEITNNKNSAIEDQQIEKNNSKKKSTKVMIILGAIIIAIIVIVLILIKSFASNNASSSVDNGIEKQQGIFDKFFGIFDKAINVMDKSIETQQEMLNKTIDQNDANVFVNEPTIEKIFSEFEISKFNNSLEIYSGTKTGQTVITVLDKIITINKTQDRRITVKYNEIETQNEVEIKNIKKQFESFEDCEVTFEYDENGFINKVIIEKI